jgi:metal-sulfur cluster biosynthetic enzyme
MFLVTKDEIDAQCTKVRYQPELDAPVWSANEKYEASAGSETAEAGRPVPTPLDIAESLKSVFDPEIPTNVYDLGLIYDINVASSGDVVVLMTLTAPNCPAAGILPDDVAKTAAGVPGTARVGVILTFDVPWDKEMMSEIADVELGLTI